MALRHAPYLMAPFLLLSLTALTVGCDDGAGAVPPPALDAEVVPDATVEPDATILPQTLIGQISVIHWLSDRFYHWPETYAHGVFSPSLMAFNVADPVGLLAYSGLSQEWIQDGYWEIPGENQAALMEMPPSFDLTEVTSLDAGDFVALGADFSAGRESVRFDAQGNLHFDDGLHVYVTDVEDGVALGARIGPGDPLNLEIEGGADIEPFNAAAVATIPENIELLSHQVLENLPLRYGTDVVLNWVPSSDPDDMMFVVIQDISNGVVLRLSDDGGIMDVTGTMRLAGYVPTPGTQIILTRASTTEVQLPEGRVRMLSAVRQYLFTKLVGPYDVDQRVLLRGSTREMTIAWYDGFFDPDNLEIDLGAGIEIRQQRLDTTEHVIHLVVSVDQVTTLGHRTIVIRSAGEEVLRIENEVFVADDLPSAGLCEDALDEGPVEDGSYIGTLNGLEEPIYAGEFFCPIITPDGPVQYIPLHMMPGETLTARTEGTFDNLPSLHLADSCGMIRPFSCVISSELLGSPELKYTAHEEEDLLLALQLSSWPDDEDAEWYYTIDIQRSAPATLLPAPTFAASGHIIDLAVRSTAGPFAADPITLALGDAEIIEAVIDPNVPTLINARVALPELTDPRSLDLSATLADGQQVTSVGAVEVIPTVTGAPTCAAAHDMPPIQSGTYWVNAHDNPNNIPAVEGCSSFSLNGSESFFRVDLAPGQTLKATVLPIQWDETGLADDPALILFTDCGAVTAEACVDWHARFEEETLVFTGPPEPRTFYLLIDSTDGIFDEYELRIELK